MTGRRCCIGRSPDQSASAKAFQLFACRRDHDLQHGGNLHPLTLEPQDTAERNEHRVSSSRHHGTPHQQNERHRHHEQQECASRGVPGRDEHTDPATDDHQGGEIPSNTGQNEEQREERTCGDQRNACAAVTPRAFTGEAGVDDGHKHKLKEGLLQGLGRPEDSGRREADGNECKYDHRPRRIDDSSPEHDDPAGGRVARQVERYRPRRALPEDPYEERERLHVRDRMDITGVRQDPAKAAPRGDRGLCEVVLGIRSEKPHPPAKLQRSGERQPCV